MPARLRTWRRNRRKGNLRTSDSDLWAFGCVRKATTGESNEELVLATTENKVASDWSRDGQFLLFNAHARKTTDTDIWALPLGGDPKPSPVVVTDFEERNGQFSPDGKWIAYESNQSGRFEVYVQPFPRGPSEPISTNGGA